jgi:hypothetical protein
VILAAASPPLTGSLPLWGRDGEGRGFKPMKRAFAPGLSLEIGVFYVSVPTTPSFLCLPESRNLRNELGPGDQRDDVLMLMPIPRFKCRCPSQKCAKHGYTRQVLMASFQRQTLATRHAFAGSAGHQPRNSGGRVMAAVAGRVPRAPRGGPERIPDADRAPSHPVIPLPAGIQEFEQRTGSRRAKGRRAYAHAYTKVHVSIPRPKMRKTWIHAASFDGFIQRQTLGDASFTSGDTPSLGARGTRPATAAAVSMAAVAGLAPPRSQRRSGEDS